MGNRFSIDCINFDCLVNGGAVSPDLTIRGLGEVDHDLGIEIDGPDSGAPYPEVRHQMRRSESLTFSTDVAVGRLMLLLLEDGAHLHGSCYARDTIDNIPPGLKVFGRKHDACGNNATATGSVHRQLLSTKGHMIFSRLELPAGRKAMGYLQATILSELGSAGGTTELYNVALPTSFTVDEWFQLGQLLEVGNAGQSVTLDVDSILGVTIEFGVSIQPMFGAARYATVVDITKTAPIVRIRTDDGSLLQAGKIPKDGLRCDQANTKIGMQKLDAATGAPVSSATAVHMTIGVNGYAYVEKGFSASGSGVSSTDIVIVGDNKSLGANDPPLLIDYDVAL